ncbi:hypothetical protein MRX96_007455 [Rhipicephalus microplus]
MTRRLPGHFSLCDGLPPLTFHYVSWPLNAGVQWFLRPAILERSGRTALLSAGNPIPDAGATRELKSRTLLVSAFRELLCRTTKNITPCQPHKPS